MPRLCVFPRFLGPDRGDGGIRRVVEAQHRYLPEFGWELVDDPASADVVATHAAVEADVAATKPLVCHTHGLYWWGYAWPNWALRMNRDVIKSMRRADIVTAPSEFVARAIRRGTQLDPPVLHHGIDLDDWSPPEAPGSGYVLWNKTRIDPICDPRPVTELAKRVPEAHFVTTLAIGEDQPSNVEITGVLPYEDAKMWVRHAGVYLATTRETFGIGTIEAMACGVPVLGWDWGGQREIVTHGVDGWLAAEGDYASLAEGLRWLTDHRAEVGRAACASVTSRFTWRQAMKRYADLYDQLLAEFREDRPRVSIVIPAYNMQEFLPSTVYSVFEDRKDVEIIIVDDASTDSTGALADGFAKGNPNIRVVHNKTNMYLAEALNVGIGAARGRYILPLDADNLLGAGAVETLASALDADRDTDIAYGAMSVIEAGKEEWISSWPQDFDYRRQMKHQNQITSTAMYRRRVWSRVGGYRRRCHTAEDADFWCRATSFGANARKVTGAVVLRYRDRQDSMSHVQQDWPWHRWYPWGSNTDLTPWMAPASDWDPVIPTHENPLVSVVIPVGPGHERLVLDALDSLNAQSLVFWEAIVVNDTGGELPWLPSWAIEVKTPGRVGAGAARNLGMARAKGRAFIFLDADDYFEPDALRVMFETLAQTGGFVYSDWYKQETHERYYSPDWDGCEAVLRELPWPVTCMYPMAAWEAVRGFDPDLAAWEDWDFAIQIVEAGYCGTRIPQALFQYRIGSGERREAGVANREELKGEILKRWGHYITGGQRMACGCSGGGGLPSLPALDLSSQNTGQAQLPPSVDGVTADQMVLIEFTDSVPAPITFTGRTTGTKYRFGSDDDNMVRYVYKSDADALLTRGEFRLYNQSAAQEPLMAAGPPR